MERLRFRSTSIADIQAELHERDLIAAGEHRRRDPVVRPRRTPFGLLIRWRRARRLDTP